MTAVVEMAPVVLWKRDRSRLFAKCPRCRQWIEIECEIEQGFTVEKVECRMHECSFTGDYLRLAGWVE